MIILGISAHHPDSAACLMIDGKVVCAIEEERFTRVKHWMGMPIQSIRWCLREAKVPMTAVDHVAINRRPWANLRLSDLFKMRWKGRGKSIASIGSLRHDLATAFDCILTAKIWHVEHHLAHAASAFFFSPFTESAILTIDGMGDLCSTMWATGKDNTITPYQRVKSPHSLGILYTAMTQLVGFDNYGDEYKMMALAALGHQGNKYELDDLVRLESNGRFSIDQKYLRLSGALMTEKGGKPIIYDLATLALADRFSRYNREDIALALQSVYEKVLLYMTSECQSKHLCLAGGCAQNTVANGKLLKYFDSIYIPPAPADNGGALGAAAYVLCQKFGKPRPEPMQHAYFGYHEEIHADRPAYRGDLIARTVRYLMNSKLVGWFQGPMEFGPRALGNRSILADPRKPEVKDKLNNLVKHREPWRPFGMSILRDHVTDYFEQDVDSPFMSFTLPVKNDKREKIPAVVHVDGSSRLQTVTRKQNALFWELLMEWYRQTGVPLLLNTSFNDNAPIVRTPSEAQDVFATTELDVLVMGAYLWKK